MAAVGRPTVAIIVPCFNITTYLERIQRLVNTINPCPDELLFVDDASTDGSAEALKAMGMTVVQTPRNLGPGGARQTGLDLVGSEWVHFHDADDGIASDYISRVIPYLSADLDVLLHSSDWVDDQTGDHVQSWSFSHRAYSGNAVDAAFVNPVPMNCSLLRTQRIRDIGGFSSQYRCWEDGDLHLRLAAAGGRFRVIDDVLTTSYRHAAGASANHLYCHRCRMQMLRRYEAQAFPISPQLMADEAMRLAGLLVERSRYREAFSACCFADRIQRTPLQSHNVMMKLAAAVLPGSVARLLQQVIRARLSSARRDGQHR